MRALYRKELRQGLPLLGLAGVLVVLAVAGSVLAAGTGGGGVTGGFIFMGFAYVLPAGLAVLAGAGLFAGEVERGTMPLLLDLPLSRRRIWAAKVLAGLTLALAATALCAGVLAILLRLLDESLMGGLAFLLSCQSWWPLAFGAAVFCSAVTARTPSAILAGLGLSLALLLGCFGLVEQRGGSLFGYGTVMDVGLWAVAALPGLLAGSLWVLTRGELLRSWRRLLPGVAIGLAGCLVVGGLVWGGFRLALRYQRPEISCLRVAPGPAGAPVVGLVALGSPVTYALDPRNQEMWQRPLYRARHAVVVDGRGRELLVAGGGGRLAVSRDGRLAARFGDQPALIWRAVHDTGGWGDSCLEVWDLRAGRRLYRGTPSGRSSAASCNRLEWSPDGKWLALGLRTSLHVVSPDGNPALVSICPTAFDDSWAWTPEGKLLYVQGDGSIGGYDPASRQARTLQASTLTVPESRIGGSIAVSPDGRWAAARIVTLPDPQGPRQTRSQPAPGRLTLLRRQGGGYVPVGGPVPLAGSVRLVWSAGGRCLYLVVRDRPARLCRWPIGDPAPRPVSLPADWTFQDCLAMPGGDDLLLWARRPAAVDPLGRVRMLPRLTPWGRFFGFPAGFLADGRLLVAAGARYPLVNSPESVWQPVPPPRATALVSLDCITGRARRLYP